MSDTNETAASVGYASSVERALQVVEATANEDLAGIRLFPRVWVPADAPIGKVFGMDGFLHWAKNWSDVPEETDDGGFMMETRIKLGYARNMIECLYAIGGRVCEA